MQQKDGEAILKEFTRFLDWQEYLSFLNCPFAMFSP
jgi:hypothetical protein